MSPRNNATTAVAQQQSPPTRPRSFTRSISASNLNAGAQATPEKSALSGKMRRRNSDLRTNSEVKEDPGDAQENPATAVDKRESGRDVKQSSATAGSTSGMADGEGEDRLREKEGDPSGDSMPILNGPRLKKGPRVKTGNTPTPSLQGSHGTSLPLLDVLDGLTN